jgi:3-oxoadipate enol-lactonase
VPSFHTSDDHTIAYSSLGRGPGHVFFLHGWGGAGSGHSWKWLLPHLDLTGLHAVVIDLRGHGKSRGAAAGFTTERFGRDMFELADHLGIEAFVVVAYSMSGRWAQWMACVEPNRVAGQVLVAPVPASDLPLTDEILGGWLAAIGTRPTFAAFANGFTKEPLAPDMLDAYFHDVSTTSPAALTGTFNMCRTGGFAEKLAASRTPTLVLAGAHDPLLSVDYLREAVAARISGARLVELDCGHEVPLERPREAAALIEAFVAGLGSDSERARLQGAGRIVTSEAEGVRQR